MPSLDDIIRAKKSQKEAEERDLQEKTNEHGKAMNTIAEEELSAMEKEEGAEKAKEKTPEDVARDELGSLEKDKRQLDFMKNALAAETQEAGTRKGAREQAEGVVASKAKELEEFGIQKEDLLRNPEYAETDEIKGLRDAQGNEDLYSTPSIGSPELAAALEKLGVEVPAEPSQLAVERAIDARMNALDEGMLDKRLEIPEEREKVVGDLVSKYNVKIDNFKLAKGGEWGEEGTYKDAYAKLKTKIDRVPLVAAHPELRTAIMEKVVKDSILAADPTYQEKMQERQKHLKKLEAYQASEKMLSEYTERLNEKFAPLFEALNELDPNVRGTLWQDNPELKFLASKYSIDFQDGKIKGPKRENDSLPSVDEMKIKMDRGMFSDGSMRMVTGAISNLKGYDRNTLPYPRISHGDFLKGNLSGVAHDLAVENSVPREWEYQTDIDGSWRKPFEATEREAEKQAQRFGEYAQLEDQQQQSRRSQLSNEGSNIQENMQDLHQSLAQLAGQHDTAFRIEGGRLINTKWEEDKRTNTAKLDELAELRKSKQENIRALGPEPSGSFLNGGKKKEWERQKALLDGEISDLDRQMKGYEERVSAINPNWTRVGNVPPEVLRELEGQIITGDELAVQLKDEMESMQPRAEELRTKEVSDKVLQRKIGELEDARFRAPQSQF